ncbi:MAG TPA: histidine phosphatase family protein [Caldilineaceae bacterium]|nr:histidine phosphatase family protein [Caldilineaceae bacterium]
MRLFIIRHAESANNRLALDLTYEEYMAQRSPDPPLTERGQRQAKLLAEHLASDTIPETYHETIPTRQDGQEPPARYGGYHITHLYCSPMLRTLQTAQPVVAALGLKPTVWVEIHEHGGMFKGNPRSGEELIIHPGLTRAAIQADFPEYELPETITEKGWWNSGYEDMPACYARAIRVARDLRRRAQEERVAEVESHIAIISHGTFVDALIKALFNQLPERQIFYHHYNTGISRIDFMPNGSLFLRYLNRVQHLPPEMISE